MGYPDKKKAKKSSGLGFREMMKEVGIDLQVPTGYIRTRIPTVDMFLAGEIQIDDETKIGLPRGKNIIISGDSGIGKSTLTLEISRRTCEQDLITLFLDFENGLNEKSVVSYNVMRYIESERMFVANPVTYKGALDLVDAAYQEFGRIDLVIVDSLRAIIPEGWVEDNAAAMNDQLGTQARKEVPFMMLMKHKAAKMGFSLIYLNQMRVKNNGYAFVQSEAGGNAAKFVPDIRLLAKEKSKIKRDVIINGEKIERHVGSWVQLFSKKNRYGNMANGISLPCIFGYGISMKMLYAHFLERAGMVTMGTWKKLAIPDLDLSFNTQKEDDIYEFIGQHYAEVEDYILKNKLIFIDKIDLNKLTVSELEELGVTKTENGFEDTEEVEKRKKNGVPPGRRHFEASEKNQLPSE